MPTFYDISRLKGSLEAWSRLLATDVKKEKKKKKKKKKTVKAYKLEWNFLLKEQVSYI